MFSEWKEESKMTQRHWYDMMCQGCLYHFTLKSALTLHIFWPKGHHDWLPDFPYQSASNLKENTSAMSSTASTKVVVNMMLCGSHKSSPSSCSDRTKNAVWTRKTRKVAVFLTDEPGRWDLYRLDLGGSTSLQQKSPKVTKSHQCGAYSCSSNKPRWMQFDITDVLWKWAQFISVGEIWPRSSNDMTYVDFCVNCWSLQSYFKFCFQAAGFLLEWKAHFPTGSLSENIYRSKANHQPILFQGLINTGCNHKTVSLCAQFSRRLVAKCRKLPFERKKSLCLWWFCFKSIDAFSHYPCLVAVNFTGQWIDERLPPIKRAL